MEKNQPFNISGWCIIRFFVFSLALVLVSDVPNNWGGLYNSACVIVGFLLFAVLVLPVRPALILLLLLAVAGKDIISSGAMDMYSTASIWHMQLGPIRPSWIMFGCLLLQFLKFQKISVPLLIKLAILWCLTVPIVTGMIYGGIFADYASIEAVTDLKIFLMLLPSTILFLSLYRRDKRNLPLVLSAFVGVLLARHLIDLVYFVANLGPVIAEGVSRASEDSAKGCIVFLVFFGVTMIWAHKRVLLGSTISILSVLLLVAYGTRMLWITFVLGCFILLFVLGFRRSVFFIFIVTLLTIAGGGALFIVHPESAKIVYSRFATITEGRPVHTFSVPVEDNLISRIDPVRYGEVLNIFDSTTSRYTYLWGTGYGGFYEDSAVDFPDSLIDGSAFANYSLETGKFYRAHFFPVHIFLKYGLVGLLCISALWIIPGYAVFKILHNKKSFASDQPKMLHSTMLSLLLFLATGMFQLYWSGKGLFVNGIIIASFIVFSSRYSVSVVEREGYVARTKLLGGKTF